MWCKSTPAVSIKTIMRTFPYILIKVNIMTEIFDDKVIQEIKRILKSGDRIELIPTKYGVKIIHIRRNEVKTTK